MTFSKAKKFIRTHTKTLCASSCLVIFASLILYIYAVNSTVRNVVERQRLENELTTLRARLGELEFEYIGLKNTVDVSRAHSLGFSTVDTTKFVSRRTSVALVTQERRGQ